jgi:phosphopantetheinyl transferase
LHRIYISTSSISISHSGAWRACAVAKASHVGVDVETIKPRNWDAYCREIFHTTALSNISHAYYKSPNNLIVLIT